MTDTDMLYMASLQKRLDEVETENAELRARVSELEGKHHNECAQIAHYDDELRRAKELLKAAVKEINQLINDNGVCQISYSCGDCPFFNSSKDDCKWQHEAEALALIGEEGESNE